MRRLGKPLRKVTMVVMVLGFIIAWWQLSRQETATSEVLLTGLYALGGVALLFGLLAGGARAIGYLVHRGNPPE